MFIYILLVTRTEQQIYMETLRIIRVAQSKNCEKYVTNQKIVENKTHSAFTFIQQGKSIE